MLAKILKKLRNLRWTWASSAAAICLIFIALISPQQVPVIIYKVCLLLLAGIVGYWLDRLVAPYARPEGYLSSDWQEHDDIWPDNKADYTVVAEYKSVFAAALIRRAIIIGCAMLAVGLGL